VKTLLVLNDPPYGTERCYNALRLANVLTRRTDQEVARRNPVTANQYPLLSETANQTTRASQGNSLKRHLALLSKLLTSWSEVYFVAARQRTGFAKAANVIAGRKVR
jgi:hypothetical protein